jgi:hypothetical protein
MCSVISKTKRKNRQCREKSFPHHQKHILHIYLEEGSSPVRRMRFSERFSFRTLFVLTQRKSFSMVWNNIALLTNILNSNTTQVDTTDT